MWPAGLPGGVAAMIGDELWVWMTEEAPGKWSQIGAFVPQLGTHGTLSHRKREVAERVFGPIAVAHGKALGQAVELRRYDVAVVDERIEP